MVLFSFDNIHEDKFSVLNGLDNSIFYCVTIFVQGNYTCSTFKSFSISKGITNCRRVSRTCTFDSIKDQDVAS